MMLHAEGNLQRLSGGLRVKARVQHPQVKPRKDRAGWPWVFRYWADEALPDGSVKTLRKYQEIGPSKGDGAITKKQAEIEGGWSPARRGERVRLRRHQFPCGDGGVHSASAHWERQAFGGDGRDAARWWGRPSACQRRTGSRVGRRGPLWVRPPSHCEHLRQGASARGAGDWRRLRG